LHNFYARETRRSKKVPGGTRGRRPSERAGEESAERGVMFKRQMYSSTVV